MCFSFRKTSKVLFSLIVIACSRTLGAGMALKSPLQVGAVPLCMAAKLLRGMNPRSLFDLASAENSREHLLTRFHGRLWARGLYHSPLCSLVRLPLVRPTD